jgi:hypothetical protein
MSSVPEERPPDLPEPRNRVAQLRGSEHSAGLRGSGQADRRQQRVSWIQTTGTEYRVLAVPNFKSYLYQH